MTALRSISTFIVVLTLVNTPRLVQAGQQGSAKPQNNSPVSSRSDRKVQDNADQMIERGKQAFRFDTFGDEAFWGGSLKLHEAIEGANLGGVGPGLSPNNALALGLKVDVDALPEDLMDALKNGKVNLNDPAVTVALLRLNAVVGVKGFATGQGGLESLGIQCAFCHSTVDNSLVPGIGHRLDGWPNRDLNVGAITALAPNLDVVADLLGTDQQAVRKVLNALGPGTFRRRVAS